MDSNFEDKYVTLERNWWWFVGRRELLLHIINQIKYNKVIEIGCGSAEMSNYLTNYTGIDISPKTCKGILGDAHKLPIKDCSVDLILLLDILEHTDDKVVMKEIHRIIKPNGHVIITVPAFNFLWSQHDIDNCHKRRYERGSLPFNNFTIKWFTYWNGIMFPLMFLMKKKKNQLTTLPNYINYILTKTLRTENWLIKHNIKIPIGVSLIYLLESKNESNTLEFLS